MFVPAEGFGYVEVIKTPELVRDEVIFLRRPFFHLVVHA